MKYQTRPIFPLVTTPTQNRELLDELCGGVLIPGCIVQGRYSIGTQINDSNKTLYDVNMTCLHDRKHKQQG